MTEIIYSDFRVIGGGLGGLSYAAGVVQIEAEMDSLAVVIPYCKVICTENFFTDTSWFALNTNGELNAPSMVTREKATENILG